MFASSPLAVICTHWSRTQFWPDGKSSQPIQLSHLKQNKMKRGASQFLMEPSGYKARMHLIIKKKKDFLREQVLERNLLRFLFGFLVKVFQILVTPVYYKLSKKKRKFLVIYLLKGKEDLLFCLVFLFLKEGKLLDGAV